MEQLADIQYNGIDSNKEYENLINKVIKECFKIEKTLTLKQF